jgi:microcystin-dependent protein
MSCTNCFNGCAETISDQCVKYTGINVPALGISTGDSLLSVENAITNFLVPAINGTGIKPIIDANIICDIVKSYLPPCTTCVGFTLNEVLTAIIKTVCDLQEQIDIIDGTLATLNADYTIGCLTGVTASSNTHAIVQAVITKLCTVDTGLTNLTNELRTMYSSNGTELNNYISSFLASQPSTNSASSKMVPYAPIAYFGPLSNYPAAGDSFDISGAGQNYWDKVYLCNGANPGVPDLRGWTLVGVTTGMFGGTLNPIVDFNIAGSGSPNYTISGVNSLHGSTTVTLGVGEIPSHTHTNTAISTAQPHRHNTIAKNSGVLDHSASSAFYYQGSTWSNAGASDTKDSGIENTTVIVNTVVTNNPIGGGGYHSNVQPSKGCYYIIYIP